MCSDGVSVSLEFPDKVLAWRIAFGLRPKTRFTKMRVLTARKSGVDLSKAIRAM